VVAIPTLLYASKTWVKKNKNVSNIQAEEIKLLRSVKRSSRIDKLKTEIQGRN
jgi:hypothetical protein